MNCFITTILIPYLYQTSIKLQKRVIKKFYRNWQFVSVRNRVFSIKNCRSKSVFERFFLILSSKLAFQTRFSPISTKNNWFLSDLTQRRLLFLDFIVYFNFISFLSIFNPKNQPNPKLKIFNNKFFICTFLSN